MSTYNGARFLDEQLESLINQEIDSSKYKLEIYCRDDGSIDSTMKKLKKYAMRYGCIKVLDNSGQNLGVKLSFFSLLKSIEADYYFFCDQDDIWNRNKVSIFMDESLKINDTIPGGMYSDLEVVDSNNVSVGNTMMSINNWKYGENRDFEFLFFKARVTGAAFAINRRARDMIIYIDDKEFSKVRMHDSIIALLISAFDNLHFIPKVTVRYRQHNDNVLGATSKKKSLADIDFRRSTMRQCLGDLKVISTILAESDISVEHRKALKAALKFYRTTGALQRLFLLTHDYRTLWNKIEFKRLIFFAFFYK